MTELDETPVVEDVWPAQDDCPDCDCCTAPLCQRGRNSVLECAGHTRVDLREVVFGCPCSAATTARTAAWRAKQVQVTRLARELPLEADAEAWLRAVLEGTDMVDDDRALFAQLRVRGLAYYDGNDCAVVTALGRTYLRALDDHRADTVVHVLDVDEKAHTARVEVAAWRPDDPVTVLLDQITGDTGLDVETLPGRWLEAEANCHAEDPDHLVLTEFREAAEVPADFMPVGEDA